MSIILRQSGKLLPLALLLLLSTASNAITYYSRVASGYWTSTTSWSTVTYNNATNAGTFPQKGDVVFIGDGHRIIMDMNAVCASVTVGQGTSGHLEFSDYLAFTMTIAGTLTINNGALVDYPGNLSRSHSLFISRHIVNNGTLDLYNDNNDLVNLTFNSTVNSVISGSGTFDLNRVTLSKNSTAYTLEVQTAAFENAIRSIVFTTGLFIHNTSSTGNLVSGLASLNVGSDVIIRVPQGTLQLVPDGDYLYLEGGLEVTGGTMVVGSPAGLQGIRYRQTSSVIPYINMTSGILEVRGGLTYASVSPTSPFVFNMTGGSVLMNSGSTGTSNPVFHVNDEAGSYFAMSNGTITLQNPNSNPAVYSDFNLCGTSGIVNAVSGTVAFGNNSTAANAVFSFEPYAGIVQPNFHVTGAPGNAITLAAGPNSTSDFSLLSLQIDANKTFDIRSVSGTPGDAKTMTLTFEMDGINALYNDGTFQSRTGNVQFQAAEGQWISGSANTVFYDFTINNPYGIVINSAMEIGNTLLMSNGIIYSSSTYPVVLNPNGSSTIGSTLSFVDGPVKKQVASVAPQNITFPVGKGSSWRPVILNVQQSSVAFTEYTTEAWNSSARALGYTLPSDLRWVSDVRYYTIIPSSTADLVSARVTLSYDTDDIVNDYTNLRVARDDGSAGWINTGGSGTANGTGSITSSTFNTFNTHFTLANPSSGVNWLPVEWISFKGSQQNGFNLLTWSTASEINSNYFELQRSENGRDFIPVAKINAAGNTSQVSEYLYKDFGVNYSAYYRIRQEDLNGDFTFTDVILVTYRAKNILTLYPNPSPDGKFRVAVNDNDASLTPAVMDASGRQVPVEFIMTAGGFESATILPAGMYIVRTGSADDTGTARLVVADTE